MDIEENFTAIVECKKSGVVSYGRGQLKSYLCATDTQFGVFANSTDPCNWEFYENLRANRFRDIKREQFESGIGIERSIEQITKVEDRFKSDRTSPARFARRREKARRANRQSA